MILKKWENLPEEMQTSEVREFYDILAKKKTSLFFKRLFDIVVSLCMLIVLSPFFLIMAILIKADSKGPVFYRQTRVTQFNKKFRIFKFRSMTADAEKGPQITVKGDTRVTRIGKVIRKYRLDEVSQLIDIFRGKMSFVGTRPESEKYAKAYTPEMMATLLLPAGVTSLASIYFKDEAQILDGAEDVDEVYITKILPAKMYYNLKSIREYGFWKDIKIMFMTVFAVLGKEYQADDEQAVITQEERTFSEKVER